MNRHLTGLKKRVNFRRFSKQGARVAKKRSTFDFEQALQELESIVARMEKGELSLEESLKDFERGIALARGCQEALKDAEQKVQILIEKGGQYDAEPYEEGE